MYSKLGKKMWNIRLPKIMIKYRNIAGNFTTVIGCFHITLLDTRFVYMQNVNIKAGI